MRAGHLSRLLLLVLPLGLSGCLLAAGQKRQFTATVQTTQVDQGVVTFEAPGRTIKGSVWKGSFSARIQGAAVKGAKQMKLKLGRGRFVARLDGVEDFGAERATNEGSMLVTFAHAKTGSVCLDVSYVSTNHTTYDGQFKAVGGTKRLARVAANGTFHEVPDPASPSGGFSASGKGVASLRRKAKGLPQRCKQLRGL